MAWMKETRIRGSEQGRLNGSSTSRANPTLATACPRSFQKKNKSGARDVEGPKSPVEELYKDSQDRLLQGQGPCLLIGKHPAPSQPLHAVRDEVIHGRTICEIPKNVVTLGGRQRPRSHRRSPASPVGGSGKSLDNGIAKRNYVYDANKNLVSETLTVGAKVFPVTYGYDGNDAHASVQYGSTKTVTYAPDAFGRPRQAAPYVTAVAYHPTGQASSFTYANGVQTTIGLDGRQWPASLQIAKNSNLFNMSYFYDPVGNVTSISDAVDTSYNRNMFYDALDRLRGIGGPWGDGVVSYDRRGNITDQSFGTFSLTYSYDPGTDRLASVGGSKIYSMNYAVYGNVTANGTSTFTYNDAANMQCARCGQTDEILFDYDGGNQRVWKRKGGLETFFVYGNSGQLLWEETPGSVLKEYIYLGDKQVATREQILP